MEQASMVVQIIQTVGFPAAMCLMMGYFLYMETNAHKSEMNDLKEELDKAVEQIATNYKTTAEVKDRPIMPTALFALI